MKFFRNQSILTRLACMALCLPFLVIGCSQPNNPGGGGDEQISVAFITNVVASFWNVAEKGVAKAGEDFDVETRVYQPTNYAAEQKRIVEDLLIRGTDGIAISVIDEEGQLDMLNSAAEQTNLITHDSDAPSSDRLCYIGMNNYDAGLVCGDLVREALPEGGEIMLFVGNLDQLNARLRRQGVIDAVLEREPDSSRYDAPGEVIKNEKYTILGTRTDGGDYTKAKADATDSILKYPDLGCMVGLFADNPPICLEAVREADKLDQIKIVAFDEADGTLQGITEGEIFGTVVQNPYMYGYESVRILAGLARGEELKTLMEKTEGVYVPEEETILFPARVIKKEADPNDEREIPVDEFWSELKELTK